MKVLIVVVVGSQTIPVSDDVTLEYAVKQIRAPQNKGKEVAILLNDHFFSVHTHESKGKSGESEADSKADIPLVDQEDIDFSDDEFGSFHRRLLDLLKGETKVTISHFVFPHYARVHR